MLSFQNILRSKHFLVLYDWSKMVQIMFLTIFRVIIDPLLWWWPGWHLTMLQRLRSHVTWQHGGHGGLGVMTSWCSVNTGSSPAPWMTNIVSLNKHSLTNHGQHQLTTHQTFFRPWQCQMAERHNSIMYLLIKITFVALVFWHLFYLW